MKREKFQVGDKVTPVEGIEKFTTVKTIKSGDTCQVIGVETNMCNCLDGHEICGKFFICQKTGIAQCDSTGNTILSQLITIRGPKGEEKRISAGWFKKVS